MISDWWKKVEDTYHDARQRDGEERVRFLDAACGADAVMRRQIEVLLEHDEEPGTFLNTSPEMDPFQTSSLIGPYRLLEIVGEGGMGVVYRARRDSSEFQQEVAIKVVGGRLFAPEAERRFITERRILASLDHPSIARMIDGGVYEGRRYLVMEFVAGEPVTRYCDSRGLSLDERLKLFQAICSAVHYAHQHLIIHRDLKPENILVTAEGRVKVLDFGIARLIDASDAEQPATTTFLHPMSLSCASPEQLLGERLTLATDIYSLGILFYELITGIHPNAGKTGSEIWRGILEEKPAAPSKLVRGISADLDAIAFKALAKNPADRYASADEMSADIGRFLDHRPVLARAPSRLYYAACFCARNRALSATVLALLVAILAGFAMSAWQARRAEQQRAIAQRRFDEARRLIRTVVHDIQPKLARIDGTVSLRASLIEQTLAYLEAMSKDARDNPALLRELIESYLELAAVTGDAGVPSTGNSQRVVEILRNGEVLVDTLLRAEPFNAASLQTAFGFYRAATRYQLQYGLASKAEPHARHALDIAGRLSAVTGGDPSSQDILAEAEANLGHCLTDLDQKIAQYERSMSLRERAIERRPADAGKLRVEAASMSRYLSTAWFNKGDAGRALQAAIQARDIDESLLGENPASPVEQINLAIDLGAMADAYSLMKDHVQAALIQRRNVELREKVAAANPDDFRTAERLTYAVEALAGKEENLADYASARRDFQRAVNMYERLERKGTPSGQSRLIYIYANFGLARLDNIEGRQQQACARLKIIAEPLNAIEHSYTPTDREKQDIAEIRRQVLSCR